ncbi:hypothetical protein QCA50_002587 [Cerrena zonata]|uniref:Uncharacterized protein n=1 Tax=Cerrena zonata TaxID=2478898 RepID=A0AAW0GK29_9APHY
MSSLHGTFDGVLLYYSYSQHHRSIEPEITPRYSQHGSFIVPDSSSIDCQCLFSCSSHAPPAPTAEK